MEQRTTSKEEIEATRMKTAKRGEEETGVERETHYIRKKEDQW